MDSPKLRVALRCVTEDLKCDASFAELDARDFVEQHKAVSKFVTMRGAAPSGGEPTYGPWPRGQLCSLHVGGARAITLYDEVQNVCWLLGFSGFHQNGHPDDAYETFIGLHKTGELLPTEDDYEAALKEDDFLELLRETGASLIAQARSHPGFEAIETYSDGGTQVICVDLFVEADGRAEEGWLGLTLPENEHLSDNDVYDFVAELLPSDVIPTYPSKFKDRERRSGEVVFKWEHYT